MEPSALPNSDSSWSKPKNLTVSLDLLGAQSNSQPRLNLEAATPEVENTSKLPSTPAEAGKALCKDMDELPEEHETCSDRSSVSSDDMTGSDTSRPPSQTGSERGSDLDLPPEEREANICSAVEFYFSDDHVAKDAFMYRHIVRGKNGFVNLKLVASFRKVKNITKDWTVVREAVRESTILSLNEEGTKVRRTVPFSPTINPLAKCVLVYSLGAKPSMGSVEQNLEEFGRICKISIFFPGQSVPNEVRTMRSQLNIPISDPVAVVEFSTAEEARKITTELVTGTGSLGVQVALLNMKSSTPRRGSRDSCSDQEFFGGTASSGGDLNQSSTSLTTDCVQGGSSKSPSRRRKKKLRANHEPQCSSDTGSESGSWRSASTGNNSPNNFPIPERANWRDSEVFTPPSQRRSNSPRSPVPSRSPTRLRTRSGGDGQSTSSGGSRSSDSVKRQPHGPSTTGFAIGKCVEPARAMTPGKVTPLLPATSPKTD